MVNAEHYNDPTADVAISRAHKEAEEKKKRRRFLSTVLRYIAENAGFDIITLVIRDKENGGTYRV